jgi:hypothetical protein
VLSLFHRRIAGGVFAAFIFLLTILANVHLLSIRFGGMTENAVGEKVIMKLVHDAASASSKRVLLAHGEVGEIDISTGDLFPSEWLVAVPIPAFLVAGSGAFVYICRHFWPN